MWSEDSKGRTGSVSALWCCFNELCCSFALFAAGCDLQGQVGGCCICVWLHRNAAYVCGWLRAELIKSGVMQSRGAAALMHWNSDWCLFLELCMFNCWFALLGVGLCCELVPLRGHSRHKINMRGVLPPVLFAQGCVPEGSLICFFAKSTLSCSVNSNSCIVEDKF